MRLDKLKLSKFQLVNIKIVYLSLRKIYKKPNINTYPILIIGLYYSIKIGYLHKTLFNCTLANSEFTHKADICATE